MENFLKSLEGTIKKYWERDALCNYKGEHFSYCDIATTIAKFALVFREGGVNKGDRIAICAKNSARWGISFLAVTTYEAVAVPILAEFTPESIQSLTNHSGSIILFTDPDIWKKMNPESMPELKCAVSATDFTLLMCRDEKISAAYENLNDTFTRTYPLGFSRENVSYPDGNGKDLAVINYTSGTTSAPKGVMIRYESLSDNIAFAQNGFPIHNGSTVVSILPMAHMYGLVVEFLYPCCHGATLYFLGKTPSPTLLLNAMKDVRPSLIVAVPLVMEKIYKSSIKPVTGKWYMKILLHTPLVGGFVYRKIGARLAAAFGGRVGLITLGGAPLNPEVEKCFKKMRVPFTVGYGMTEGAPLLSYASWKEYVIGSCGKPRQETRIISEDPARIAGEIQVKGINICSGYFKNDEANAASFTDDGFFRTGDLGIIDSKGNLFIRGRCKTMILSANGQNIYPEEIESLINNQDYVAESLVVDRSSRLVALVYLDKDAIKRNGLDDESIADIPEKIRINANRELPSYSQLTKIEIVLAPFEKTPKMSIKRFLYK